MLIAFSHSSRPAWGFWILNLGLNGPALSCPSSSARTKTEGCSSCLVPSGDIRECLALWSLLLQSSKSWSTTLLPSFLPTHMLRASPRKTKSEVSFCIHFYPNKQKSIFLLVISSACSTLYFTSLIPICSASVSSRNKERWDVQTQAQPHKEPVQTQRQNREHARVQLLNLPT